MNTDEHRYLKDSAKRELVSFLRNLCVSVCICGSKFFSCLRAVLDDDAYDRYLTRRVTLSEAERQRGGVEGSPALSPAEFYRLRLDREYSRPSRCC